MKQFVTWNLNIVIKYQPIIECYSGLKTANSHTLKLCRLFAQLHYLGKELIELKALIKIWGSDVPFWTMIICIPVNLLSVCKDCVFCSYSFYSGPVCTLPWRFAHVSDVLCGEFWTIALSVYFSYAFKEENICVTLKKYFSSACCSGVVATLKALLRSLWLFS